MSKKAYYLHLGKNEEEMGEMVREMLEICLGLRYNTPTRTDVLRTHLSSSLVEGTTGSFPFPRPGS